MSLELRPSTHEAFAERLRSAEAQCQQQRAAYVTVLSPERLEAIQRNAAKPRPTVRRITIERERERVVLMSQCPYVSAQPVNRRII